MLEHSSRHVPRIPEYRTFDGREEDAVWSTRDSLGGEEQAHNLATELGSTHIIPFR